LAEIRSGSFITCLYSEGILCFLCGLGVHSMYKFILIFGGGPFPRMPSLMHVGWTSVCARKINVVSMIPEEMSLTETVTVFTSLARLVACV
jgi:hypothetical protein